MFKIKVQNSSFLSFVSQVFDSFQGKIYVIKSIVYFLALGNLKLFSKTN